MSKEIRFKLFELPTHQVMAVKDDNEDEEPIIQVTFFVEGMKVAQAYGYLDDESRDRAFEKFNEELASMIIDKTISFFAKCAEEQPA